MYNWQLPGWPDFTYNSGEIEDALFTYPKALTKAKLFEWHKMLLKQSKGINTGAWRHLKQLLPGICKRWWS